MIEKLIKMMHTLIRVWQRKGTEKTGSEIKESTREVQVHSGVSRLTEQVTSFLQANYDFRFNLLTEETEFCSLNDSEQGFIPIGKRELNTFCMEAHVQGIPCWDKDISRYIFSTHIGEYHPFRLYMNELPAWDGVDRVTPLAKRVSELPLWVSGFHTWLLGLTAQWEGVVQIHANSVAPLLISSEQGKQKSTFCKSLMPEPLRRYYFDNFKLTSEAQAERLLAEMGLINLDEFDKYASGKMPVLKNLMQMSSLTVCKAYQRNFRSLPRIASFIGTSNRFDLLNDPTGSRRFLCVKVENPIDCDGIEHSQLFAQLKAELKQGAVYWFTHEAECAWQRNNSGFYKSSLVEDVFYSCFRLPQAGEESERLSAADIFKELKNRNAAALRAFNPSLLAQILLKLGAERKHTECGNVYEVVRC
ncbi:hypothetical protein GGR06_000425 [Bacteroides reticulotermitis]|uniref:Uncharacterized protein n=3 Tax=Bacteroides reticulotermitis TaxID=1133319 RepID=W4UMT2_9BACE|nr:VapE domain-containing protein [Bacteroides reticulotermitis]MBB4042666.1 hypothetical protein [Bacteroides reticulotermitis]GAE82276.1 hypothetical protein JCM10512_468 [Bacteroides reticulotermitis JCM 10512]